LPIPLRDFDRAEFPEMRSAILEVQTKLVTPGRHQTVAELKRPYDAALAESKMSIRKRIVINVAAGDALLGNQTIDEAFPYLKEAAELAKQLPADDPTAGMGYMAFAVFMQRNFVHDLTVDYAAKALPGIRRLNESSSNAFHEREVFQLLYNGYYALGQRDSAMHYYQKTIERITDEGNLIALVNIVNNYGLFLHQNGAYAEALREFDRGVILLRGKPQNNVRTNYLNILESKAHSLVKLDSFDSAIDQLTVVYNGRKSLDLPIHAMRAMGYLLRYYQQEGMSEKALSLFRQEEAYLQKDARVKRNNFKFFRQIAELLSSGGWPEEALHYEHLYNRFVVENPEVSNLENIDQNIVSFTNLRNENYEQRLEIQKLSAAQLRADIRERNLLAIGLMALLICTLSLGYAWYRNRRSQAEQRLQSARQAEKILVLENDNLKYKITTKERDLERIAADNVVRTDLKKQFIGRLDSLVRLRPSERDKELVLLTNELSATVAAQEEMSLLQQQIETINASFEEKLRDRVPGITRQEIKLCSLVRIGMTNQQISALLNRSESTIRSYKFRLRKKADWSKVDFERTLSEL
jgi:tetratricopeptide (TPR) repeat protein